MSTTETPATTTVLRLEESWGGLSVSDDGGKGFWAEHVSRPHGAGSLVRKRWHVAGDGTAHSMAWEAGDPRFQGLSPITSG